MKFLFLFMDGIGLHQADPEHNPLAKAAMPNLHALLNGQPMVAGTAPLVNEKATLLALDANLGVDGLPQSATGQAALLTGENVPARIGQHYGPKPNPPVRAALAEGTLFSQLAARGYQAALLNAYPAGYFEGINSGKRLYSAIPQAVVDAGIALKTAEDLYARQAISADFTGQGWHDHLGYTDLPLMSAPEAGRYLAGLAASYDFAFFEYWPSDYAGHRQNHAQAIALMESFDAVLGGLVASWPHEDGLILITSDHGNMEDLSTRRHTANPVPALVIGALALRHKFTTQLHDLTDVAPAIMQFYP